MTIENCDFCGGTHYGSNVCPYKPEEILKHEQIRERRTRERQERDSRAEESLEDVIHRQGVHVGELNTRIAELEQSERDYKETLVRVQDSHKKCVRERDEAIQCLKDEREANVISDHAMMDAQLRNTCRQVQKLITAVGITLSQVNVTHDDIEASDAMLEEAVALIAAILSE